MTARYRMAALFVGCVAALTACGGDGPTGPAGPEGPRGGPGPVSYLVIGAENADYRVAEVALSMFGEGSFAPGSTVDTFNARTLTPTLNDLAPHDVVLVYGDFAFADSIAVGDVLADYVDAGGNVVLTQRCFSITSNDEALGGRIMTPGYSPFGLGPGAADGTDRIVDLSALALPPHPVFTGIDLVQAQFPAFPSYSNPPVQGTVTLIAVFTNGHHGVAINAAGTVMAINLAPGAALPSETVRLFANAVLFLAGELRAPDPDGSFPAPLANGEERHGPHGPEED